MRFHGLAGKDGKEEKEGAFYRDKIYKKKRGRVFVFILAKCKNNFFQARKFA
jgi:hypothetical protein